MKKRFISICLLLFFSLPVLFYSIPVQASGGSIFLAGNYVGQDKTNWCWAACSENLIRWEGNPYLNQWNAVYYIFGQHESDPYPDKTASIAATADAAGYISNFQHSYVGVNSPMSDSFLYWQLCCSHPVVCSGGLYVSGKRKNGHQVLVCGWYDGSYQSTLTYFDSALQQYRTCSYSEFCNGSFNGRIYDRTCYHL